MTRIQRETYGNRPLADTTLGTAGEVTGTERSKLQQILDGAKFLATAAVDGLMRATDKAKLDGIAAGAQANPPGSIGNVGNTWVVRDGSGNFSAGTITANLNGNASSASNTPNATNAGYATSAGSATYATAAGDLAPSLARGSGVNGSWNYAYMTNGKRMFSTYVTTTPSGGSDQIVATIGSPGGLGMGQSVNVVASTYGVNANQISASVRGAGNTASFGATSIEVVVATTDGAALNSKNAGHVGVMLLAMEI